MDGEISTPTRNVYKRTHVHTHTYALKQHWKRLSKQSTGCSHYVRFDSYARTRIPINNPQPPTNNNVIFPLI